MTTTQCKQALATSQRPLRLYSHYQKYPDCSFDKEKTNKKPEFLGSSDKSSYFLLLIFFFFFFFAQLLVHILLITGVHDKSITICSWFPSIDKCGVLFEVESTHVISKSQEPHIFVWITRSFLHVCLISKRKKSTRSLKYSRLNKVRSKTIRTFYIKRLLIYTCESR